MLNKKDLKPTVSRNTPVRAAVLKIFEDKHKPLSIKEVVSLIKIPADESTVYRVVNFFVEQGLLKQVFIQKDATFYELANREDHHHLVCTNCKKITDFHGCGVDSLVKNALKQNPEFKIVNSHSLELFGLCRTCA